MWKRTISWIGLCLLWVLPAWGQSLRVQLPGGEIEVGKTFEVAFLLTGNPTFSPQFPDFRGLRKISGPREEEEMINVQGQLVTQTVYRFYLQVDKPGTYLIGTATATVGSDVVASDPVTFRVKAPVAELTEADQAQRRALQTSLNRNVSLDATLSATTRFVGEPVELTYDLWIDAELSGQIGNITQDAAPEFQGFSAVPLPFKSERVLAMRGGKRYIRTRIAAFRLIPQSPGSFRLDSLPLSMTVAIPRSGRVPQNDLETFQQQFQPAFREYRHQMISSVPKLVVTALPAADRPLNFTGLVGSIRLKIQMEDSTVTTGTETRLVLQYEGEADFALLSPATLVLPPGMEAFPPQVDNPLGAPGKRISYSLVARKPGTFRLAIPAVSYFDPRRRQYLLLGGDTLTLRVTGEELTGPLGLNSEQQQQDRFDPALLPWNQRPPLLHWLEAAFWWIFAGLWLAWAGWFVWLRSRKKRMQDPVYLANRKLAMELDHLNKQAREALKAGNLARMYAFLLEYLWVSASAQLGLERIEQTERDLGAALSALERPLPEGDRLLQLLAQCREGAFGSGSDPALAADVLEKAVKWGSARPLESATRAAVAKAREVIWLLLFLTPFLSPGQGSREAADQLYGAGNYATAQKQYEEIYQTGEAPAELFHNWGNAAYQAGDLGRAIWAYEKALKQDPHQLLTRQNLQFARKSVQHPIPPRPRLALEQWWQQTLWGLGRQGWSLIALVLLATLLGSWAWQFSRDRGLSPGWSLLLLLLVGGCLWLRDKADPNQPGNEAIVLQSISLREAPEGQRELLLLSPGVQVIVGETVAGWREVRVSDPEAGELLGYLPMGSVAEF